MNPQAGAYGAAAPSRLRHNSHVCRRLRERWNSALGGPSSPALPDSERVHLSTPRAHLAPRFVSRPPRIPCTLLQFTIMLASPRLPLQGQRESAYVSITAEELRLWKQLNKTKRQTSQTDDPPAFSIAGSPLPTPDVDPGTLEKHREKVTKLSWEESELAKRSLQCSRAAH